MNANSLRSYKRTATCLAEQLPSPWLGDYVRPGNCCNASGTGADLHRTHSLQWSDGANPYAGLTIDAAGNLYGTTFAGGSGRGYGSV